MAEFDIKANDTRPFIEADLSYADETTPDLTVVGTVVTFIMARPGQPVKVRAAAEVVTGWAARVRYRWLAVDTNEVAADFRAEWEVVFPDGSKQTFPTNSYHSVAVIADLDSR